LPTGGNITSGDKLAEPLKYNLYSSSPLGLSPIWGRLQAAHQEPRGRPSGPCGYVTDHPPTAKRQPAGRGAQCAALRPSGLRQAKLSGSHPASSAARRSLTPMSLSAVFGFGESESVRLQTDPFGTPTTIRSPDIQSSRRRPCCRRYPTIGRRRRWSAAHFAQICALNGL
jgi:hypothetical protein